MLSSQAKWSNGEPRGVGGKGGFVSRSCFSRRGVSALRYLGEDRKIELRASSAIGHFASRKTRISFRSEEEPSRVPLPEIATCMLLFARRGTCPNDHARRQPAVHTTGPADGSRPCMRGTRGAHGRTRSPPREDLVLSSTVSSVSGTERRSRAHVVDSPVGCGPTAPPSVSLPEFPPRDGASQWCRSDADHILGMKGTNSYHAEFRLLILGMTTAQGAARPENGQKMENHHHRHVRPEMDGNAARDPCHPPY